MTHKIATCCYCGTRAALVLKGRERHELACSRCGAPLHDLKMLKIEHPGRSGVVKPSPVRGAPRPQKRDRPTRRRRRKSFGQRVLEEAWDVIEDIFD